MSEVTSPPTQPGAPAAGGMDPTDAPRDAPARAPETGRPIGLGLALIAIGLLWLVSAFGVEVPLRVVLPTALLVIGIAVMLPGTARFGDGLVGLGVVVSVFAMLFALVGSPVSFSVGDRSVEVGTLAELEDTYALGAGTLTIDLRELTLPGGTTDLVASVGMGELRVLVPDDVTVVGEARVGLGELDVFGRSRDGVGPTVELGAAAGAELGTASGADGPVLELDAKVGMGTLEVRR